MLLRRKNNLPSFPFTLLINESVNNLSCEKSTFKNKKWYKVKPIKLLIGKNKTILDLSQDGKLTISNINIYSIFFYFKPF